MELNPDYNLERSIAYILDKSWGLFDKINPIDQIDLKDDSIPQIFKELPGKSKMESLELIWKDAFLYLPDFRKLLESSLIGLFVGNGIIGPVLVYFLERWDQRSGADGIMMACPPTNEQDITAWEAKNGTLPDSIKKIWKAHGFLLLRGGVPFTSLLPSNPSIISHPVNFGEKHNLNDPKQKLECLGIAGISADYPFCLTRQIGEKIWTDNLVDVFRFGNTWEEGGHSSLDSLFVGYE
ncbi:MAG: hypothetical protein H6581_20910 [Bacteroidia bacterium]|nr:hypothetical protein [Bacteroidia bacterium]